MTAVSISAVLRAGLRVVEVGAEDLRLARFFLAQVGPRYLCLARRELLDATARGAAPGDEELAAHLWPYDDARQLAANNAELLVLSGGLPRHLWSCRRYAQTTYVAWELLAPRWETVLALLGAALGVLRRRLTIVGVVRVPDDGGAGRVLMVARVRRTKPPGPRRFLSPVLGVHGLLAALAARDARYVVLRWFDGLPAVEPGEDVDLLVADEELPHVETILSELPGILPVDLYTVSGLPGTSYREMAYYPPALAERILAGATPGPGGSRVPSPAEHLLSLAYHAVYHKGLASGIPTSEPGLHAEVRPDHDYAGVLRRLAREQGVELEMTLEGLDAHLASRGWRPPYDTLARLSVGNEWLARRVARLAVEAEADHPGLAAFVVRQAACDLGLYDEIVERLRTEGFVVLREYRLDEDQRARVGRGVRGGNWGRGPWPRSGGGPAALVVAIDPRPIAPRRQVREQYPHVWNERLLVKDRIRQTINARLPADQRCNVLHSSDNAAEAITYLRLACAADVPALLARARSVRGTAPAAAGSSTDRPASGGAPATTRPVHDVVPCTATLPATAPAPSAQQAPS